MCGKAGGRTRPPARPPGGRAARRPRAGGKGWSREATSVKNLCLPENDDRHCFKKHLLLERN